jgi:hypothetical protein
MHILFITLIFALSGLAVAQTSYVAPTKTLAKTGHQLGVGGDYWASQKRVDTDGKSFDFEDGEAFSRIQGNVFGAYGLTDNLQVGGGVRMRQNRSTLFNATTNENETDTSTGLESTFVNFIFFTACSFYLELVITLLIPYVNNFELQAVKREYIINTEKSIINI